MSDKPKVAGTVSKWHGKEGVFQWRHEGKTQKLHLKYFGRDRVVSHNMVDWFITILVYEVTGLGLGRPPLRRRAAHHGRGPERWHRRHRTLPRR